MEYLVTAALIVMTIGSYILSRRICLQYQHPLLNVIALSSASIMILLVVLDIPYESYKPGKDIMTALLGPTTVALAVPLYSNRAILKKHLLSIALVVLMASTVTSLAAMAIVQMVGLPQDVVVSIGPKSVTAPVAAEVARINGGDPGLAIAFVVMTGVLGATFGPLLLTLLRVHSPLIRGLALGTVSHGQGTAIALLEGERQGTMAGIGMAVSAIITSTMFPAILPIVLS